MKLTKLQIQTVKDCLDFTLASMSQYPKSNLKPKIVKLLNEINKNI